MVQRFSLSLFLLRFSRSGITVNRKLMPAFFFFLVLSSISLPNIGGVVGFIFSLVERDDHFFHGTLLVFPFEVGNFHFGLVPFPPLSTCAEPPLFPGHP